MKTDSGVLRSTQGSPGPAHRGASRSCLWPAVLGLLLFVSSVEAAPAQAIPREEFPVVLEQIARGYEAQNYRDSWLHVEGRIFDEQKAAEGATIAENQKFEPKWMDFKYFEKGGKRRLERENRRGTYACHVLDNNEEIVYFANKLFRVYGAENEEDKWIAQAPEFSWF